MVQGKLNSTISGIKVWSSMKRKMIYKVSILLLLLLATDVIGQEKPNIVFILADDLGWSDTELFGTTTFYKTPNINKLASKGMLFTQAYTPSPVCSPTRASIVTGQYFSRFGITNARCHLPEARLQALIDTTIRMDRKAKEVVMATRLDTTHYILPEFLNDNGYTTGHFGKWHLGLPPYNAIHQGFDMAVPKSPEGAITQGYLAPWPALEKEGFTTAEGVHIEDRMAQEARSFIIKNQDRPFFLNYWAFSIHSPWSGKKELTENYALKVDPLSPQRNPVYAAMVHSLDEAVGVVLDTLDELGLTENTLIVFTSDNGGNTWAPRRTEPEGYAHIPGTSNYPMRKGKGWHYEGGTRVPLIVSWPGHIEPGSNSNEQISSIDFYPTLIDLLQLEKPKQIAFDGISFSNTLLKGERLPERPLYGFHPHYNWGDRIPPSVWVRKGDWKLIRMFAASKNQKDSLELYNLRTDIFESSEQKVRFPEKAEQLNVLIDDFLTTTQAVYPIKNEHYQD